MRPRHPVHKTRWIAFPLALYFLEMRPKAPARPEGAQLSNPYLTVPSMDPPLPWPLPAPLPSTCSLRPCSRLPVRGAGAPSCGEPSLTTLSSGPGSFHHDPQLNLTRFSFCFNFSWAYGTEALGFWRISFLLSPAGAKNPVKLLIGLVKASGREEEGPSRQESRRFGTERNATPPVAHSPDLLCCGCRVFSEHYLCVREHSFKDSVRNRFMPGFQVMKKEHVSFSIFPGPLGTMNKPISERTPSCSGHRPAGQGSEPGVSSASAQA